MQSPEAETNLAGSSAARRPGALGQNDCGGTGEEVKVETELG